MGQWMCSSNCQPLHLYGQLSESDLKLQTSAGVGVWTVFGPLQILISYSYGHSIKCKKAVHTPAEVCSCMDTLFATPKTVHTPAEVCSLRSEFEGGPKTVHTPAEVCSLRSDSESCPYNCRGRQFELHIHCPSFSLLRKLSLHLQRSTVLF